MRKLVAVALATLAAPLAITAQDGKSCGSQVSALSADQAVSIIEVAHNSDSLLLFGTGAISDSVAKKTPYTMRRQLRSEVDPRSHLLVRFGVAPGNCVPSFGVRLRGSVIAANSKRALEIPYYFEAGKEQPAPQPRGQLFSRAARLVFNARADIDARLRMAARERVLVDTNERSTRTLAATADSLAAYRSAVGRLLAQRADVIQRATGRTADTTERTVVRIVDSLGSLDDSISRISRSLEERLAVGPRTDANARLRADGLRRAIRQLAGPSLYLQAIDALSADNAAGLRRELSAVGQTDPMLLRRQMQLVMDDVRRADEVVASRDASAEALEATYRELVASLRSFSDFLWSMGTLASSSGRLELPDVLISLASSSVKEGERVVLNVDFIADDNSVLSSGTLSLEVRRLGKAIINVRDVAYFVTRCDRNCFSKARSPSQVAAAQLLRTRLVNTPATDRIAYENASRYADIPTIDRASPSPGVAFEALVRPRVRGEGWRASVASVIRTFGLSYGISASLLQFTDSRVQLEAPPFQAFREALAKGAIADTMIRVQTITDQKGKLGVAAALHVGLFDGAISGAYGHNLAVGESPRFLAVGLSFMALTDAGKELMAKFGSAGSK